MVSVVIVTHFEREDNTLLLILRPLCTSLVAQAAFSLIMASLA